MRHTEAQELLYEYLAGELNGDANAGTRVSLEGHLAGCAACRKELEDIRVIVSNFQPVKFDAAAARPDGYWNTFASGVERRIETEKQTARKRKPLLSFGHMLDHMFFTPRPYVTAFAGALAVLICMLLVFRWLDRREITPSGGDAGLASAALTADDSTAQRVHQYMSRSKMLLVGISNMKPVSETTFDVTTEQEKSRELLHEARYLKSQPLDARSQRLIEDLEKILIELANMKSTGNAPNVEIIRGGMHQENLLFKIRMEEQAFSPQRDSSGSSS